MSQDNRTQEEWPEEFSQTPEEEWPEGYATLMSLVRAMGTDWVKRATDQAYEECVNE